MTTLYHSYSYTPYENAPIEPYSYPIGQAITRELIENTVAYQTEIRELIRYEETDRFGIAEIYPYGADDQPEYFDRLLTYLIEEKLLSDSSQFLAILEDSYKAGMERTERIMSSKQMARRMMLDIGDKRQDQLVAIDLETQNRIIQQKTVFIGGVRRSIAEPREILHYACQLMATSLIVAHNHPSGETYPSRNDLDFTDKLKRSCDDLGICLLDHLIIGKGTYYSFREEREDFDI